MGSKIDTTSTMRDRQDSRSEKATSNAQYVKDLKSTNSLKPPQKLFKEDADYINRSTTTPKKDKKVTASKENAELTILKEKFKENASGKKDEKGKKENKVITTQITGKLSNSVQAIHTLMENSKLADQGPQVKLYDAMERYELAQTKYLEIKEHLPEKAQNELEFKLEKMRKEIEELTQKVSGSGVAGIVLRPVENEEENPGGGLGNIADKLSNLTELGIPIIPGKKKDNSEEDVN